MINNKTMPNPMMPKGKPMSPLTVIVAIVVIIVVGAVIFKLAKTGSIKPGAYVSPTGSARHWENYTPGSPEDMRQLIEAVSRHIVVNSQEVPSVATIEDADVLRSKNSVFYKDAINGDRLMIYTDKAILYSPSRDTLLNVMPVFSAPTAGQAAAVAAPGNEVALVEVRNGSGLNGMGKTVATNLRSSGLSVLPPVDAQSKTRYAETLIYVNSGKALPSTVAKLQSLTGGKVVTSLTTENGFGGDVVVIVGANIKR